MKYGIFEISDVDHFNFAQFSSDTFVLRLIRDIFLHRVLNCSFVLSGIWILNFYNKDKCIDLWLFKFCSTNQCYLLAKINSMSVQKIWLFKIVNSFRCSCADLYRQFSFICWHDFPFLEFPVAETKRVLQRLHFTERKKNILVDIFL